MAVTVSSPHFQHTFYFPDDGKTPKCISNLFMRGRRGTRRREGGASDDGEKLERMRLDRNSTAAEARRREKGRKEKREREAAKERTLAVSSVGIRPKRRRERRERERGKERD